ncbi:MAG: CBS domain-containing protein [Candidatus Limnocylindrales bacterium]
MSTSSGLSAGSTPGPGVSRESTSLANRDLRSERVGVVMRRDPIVVTSGTSVGAGIGAIQSARADCLLVAAGDVLAGILTERDVMLKIVGRDVDLATPVDSFMTAGPDALTPEATMGEALALMDRGGYRHVPLVDAAGRIVGLLRQQDILAYVAEAFPESILNLPPRPHQRLQEQDGA